LESTDTAKPNTSKSDNFRKILIDDCYRIIKEIHDAKELQDDVYDGIAVVFAEFVTYLREILQRKNTDVIEITELLDAQIESLRHCILRLNDGKQLYIHGAPKQ